MIANYSVHCCHSSKIRVKGYFYNIGLSKLWLGIDGESRFDNVQFFINSSTGLYLPILRLNEMIYVSLQNSKKYIEDELWVHSMI